MFMKEHIVRGFRFGNYNPPEMSVFDRLLEIFTDLLTHTSGDFDEAIDWLRMLDEEYELTTPDYTIDDFIEDLKKKRYIREEVDPNGNGSGVRLSAKMEQNIRKQALKQIFGNLEKSGTGNHKTIKSGVGEDNTGELRNYNFGDPVEKISITESLKNAQINNGIGDFDLTESDLVVEDSIHQSQMSTVLMIDISHSMILYGEDRITPAKKVAMALAELITTRYPKDTLDIIVFGDDAWPVKIQELPYLQVGPYHTNTVAGLQLAMDILRRKRNTNKQIFMITDGKPSCVRESDGTYYMNSYGLDEYVVQKCYNMASQARRLHIPITTFMIAQDSYLQQFIREFTEANQGKAFYTGLNGLGQMIFEDYETNRKKRIR
ncbi:von Willebrand factor type A domain-containing protein [Chryseobacterium taichungense]|uniref:von Willebrand factor type A domain-containing protein n=2 Tax=Chryseobacterium taichungense TaxID=295069 RepID=A0A1H8DQY2_9FLAO|nr:von Willebrand factor type A domain-containing protein [Chryseobacterium taichungense]